MEARKIVALTVAMTVLLVLAGGVGLVLAQGPNLGSPVGTAFTYQGQLTDNGDPAQGTYDFEFKLHDDPTLDSQVGSTVYVDDKEVKDGLFTVQLDFGSGVFNGEARYLEIGVRPGDSSGGYTTLAPRQELTPAPYALHSLSTGSLQGYPVSDTLPTTGQLLQWNGSTWEPASVGSANQPPVAVFQADPAVLMPGHTALLSLEFSYDPEGSPLTYAFDPTGQAVGVPGSYGPRYSRRVTCADYPTAGDYLAAGWVKDGAGFFDIARALVSVYAFSSTSVDVPVDVGGAGSLAVVDGNPAITYLHYDYYDHTVMYVQARDATGSSWGNPLALDSGGGGGPSLAVVDNRPAIAYGSWDGSNLSLKYVRASDASGSSWDTPVTVDGFEGSGASLAVVDGHPAIAYYGSSSHELKYVRASDATGSSWDTPVTVDSDGDVGSWASLAVVDGNPAIAYYDTSTRRLKYVRASDTTGSSWDTPLTVDSDGNVGQWASLAVVDNRPAIAYHEAFANRDLKYVRASDATGSSWDTPLIVDSSANVLGASLAVVYGRPTIAYCDLDPNFDLKYVCASDATGSSWGTPITVDSSGEVGMYPSLAVVETRPAIVYNDDTNQQLRFAIPRQE